MVRIAYLTTNVFIHSFTLIFLKENSTLDKNISKIVLLCYRIKPIYYRMYLIQRYGIMS